MFQKLSPRFYHLLSITLLATLLFACAPTQALVSPTTPPDQTGPTRASPTTAPTFPTPVDPPTQAAAQPTEAGAAQPEATTVPASMGGESFTINHNGVALNAIQETVPAKEQSDDSMWWMVLPEYKKVTLEGYPINGSALQPQVFIYPASDLALMNEAAGHELSALQTLLESQQVGEKLPLLPLDGTVQVMHAQVKFLDFQGGKGVRFLTQTSSGITPINNQQLFYSFQGLTSDGAYYVAAVLPVNYPGLPADGLTPLPTENPFWSDFPGYKVEVVKMLEGAAASAFTPDFAALDLMIESFEVK